LADLFLDTLPYNAHTTASEALWMGLPVLTRCGETFASRVASSLLQGMQISELITTTASDFEQVAINLATHPKRLTSIKRRIANERLTTPVFDTASFTSAIEKAYRMMLERHMNGLAPDDIFVPR